MADAATLTITIAGPQGSGKTLIGQRLVDILAEAGAVVAHDSENDDADRLTIFGLNPVRLLPVTEPDLSVILQRLVIDIHASNVAAGWWTDLDNGAPTQATRNRPEMLMLAVSELAEAASGIWGSPDDKLIHLPMYDVELADFVIRQLDQIGAEVSLGCPMPNWSYDSIPMIAVRHGFRAMSRSDRLMELVKVIAAAMEHYRKQRTNEYVLAMVQGVLLAFEIAEIEHIDLLDIIAQKRAFNATRADHKVENRRAADGKQF